MSKFVYRYKQSLFILFILITVAFFHRRSVFMPPTAIHGWAAADWYALSVGFLNNGMDFFHPEVNQLNLQFPANVPLENPSGITSVDFPINPYIVAVIMKLFHSQNPSIFRLYTLLLSLLGLYFLFKAVRVRSGSFLLAAFAVCFIRFQPSYAYYMDGFIPTQNALSVFFIGLYFLVLFRQTIKTVHLAFTVFFFMLAGLMRMPFSIPLIALMGVYVLSGIKTRRWEFMPMLLVGAGLLGIFSYFLYNRMLSQNYGSVFLNHILPGRNIKELLFFIVGGFSVNIRLILTFPHLFILAVLGVLLSKRLKDKSFVQSQMAEILFVSLVIVGGLMYALLMSRQLLHHDYYYNDFLFPGIIVFLLWVLGLNLYPAGKVRTVVVLLFISAVFQISYEWRARAYNSGFEISKTIATAENYEGAGAFLDQNHISPNAVLLVVGSYAPSIPPNNLHRKCYGVWFPNKEEIDEALQWNFDYIVTQNQFFDEIIDVYPEWDSRVEALLSNGKITLHRLK